MSEKLDQVAKVLFGWMHGHERWDDAQSEEREDCIEAARAVIEAMREDTDAMYEAGVYYSDTPQATWRAMIDAALGKS